MHLKGSFTLRRSPYLRRGLTSRPHLRVRLGMRTVGGTGSEVPGATLSSEEFDFPEYIIGEGGSLHPLRRVSPKKNKKSNKNKVAGFFK